MSGKYVRDGAKIKCPLCSKKKGKLKVTSNEVKVQDKPAATEGDNGKQNLQFQGNCTHPQFSGGPPPPCKSVIQPGKWQKTSETKFDEQKALVEGSCIICKTGKVPITIEDTTQTSTPTNLAAMDAAAAPVPGQTVAVANADNTRVAQPNYNSFVWDEPVDTQLKGMLIVQRAYFAHRKVEPQYDDKTKTYTVKKGDTLWGIAQTFDTTVGLIQQENNIRDEEKGDIAVGDSLQITTKVKVGKDVTFERDKDGATLGQEVWVVVKYAGEVKSMNVQLKEKKSLLVGQNKPLPVVQDGSQTTTITLKEPNASTLQGRFMVANIKLRPKSDNKLKKWRKKLTSNDSEAKKSLLSIKVTAKGGESVAKPEYRGGTEKKHVFLDEKGAWFEIKAFQLIWGEKVSCEFRKKVVEISEELWPKNYMNMANYLMAIFAWETGRTFDSGVPNMANSGGTGLIQFMPATARDLLGKPVTIEYTDEFFGRKLKRIKEFADMTEVEQLEYVKKYFKSFDGKKAEFIDVYLKVLFPASSLKPDHIVFAKNEEKLTTRSNESETLKRLRINAYAQNSGLDVNSDGVIWKHEIKNKVQKYVDNGKPYKASVSDCK